MPYSSISELPSLEIYRCPYEGQAKISEVKILCEAGNFYTLSINRWDLRGKKLPSVFLGLFSKQ